MMAMGQAASVMAGHLRGGDAQFIGVATDSRTLRQGDLFFALRGPNHDGHAYLAAAAAAGAAGAVIDRLVRTDLTTIQVADATKALGDLAAHWRRRHALPIVVGVTGSNGKTTVKEMIAAVLGKRGKVLATLGNLNNAIGVPLTLLRLRQEHAFAVIELATSAPGEIAYTAGLTAPTVGVITNAAVAHLAGLGTLDAVAAAKGELIDALPNDGCLVLNAEDRYANVWRERAGRRRILTFAMDRAADIKGRAKLLLDGSELAVMTPIGEIDLRLPLLGLHNARNALAAVAVAVALRVPLSAAVAGLARVTPVPGRLCLSIGVAGCRLIDDAYNANPQSVIAAIDVLSGFPGRRILVLGDLAELGAEAGAYHTQVGGHARGRIDMLCAVGIETRHSVEAFGPGAHHFADKAELIDFLKPSLGSDAVVLVKGSRSAGMETVLAELRAEC